MTIGSHPEERPGVASDGTVNDTVDVPGARLAISVSGEGPVLVWGHGLVSSRAQEDEVGLFPWDLAPHARLVRYDARGHGRSTGRPEERDYRWENLAADLLAVADALGTERFAAGGASLGAATALHAAVRAPGRIERLVLAVPPAAWSRRPAQAQVYEKMAGIIEAKGLARFAELTGRAGPPYPFLDEAMPEVARIFLDHVRRWDERLVPHVLRAAAASDLPPPEALREVTAPAIVLTWAGDPGHPSESAVALADALPSCELHVAQHPDELRSWPDLVRSFLARRP